jgi:transcriptional regulator with XRE-family HTH domain
MTVGQKIKQLREEHGLNRHGLSKKLGVTPPIISRWERDINEPHLYSLMGMADLFGVTLDELCCYTPRERKDNESKNE